MDERTKLHVPLPPAVVVHCPSELDPFQVPGTVAPFTRLCLQSCTVIFTVADHLLMLLAAPPSRLPTWRLGGVTAIPIARASLLRPLLAQLSVTGRTGPFVGGPAVFHVESRGRPGP